MEMKAKSTFCAAISLRFVSNNTLGDEKIYTVQVDPRFSSQKQYFWKLMYKSTPMIDDTKQNKTEGITDKKQ